MKKKMLTVFLCAVAAAMIAGCSEKKDEENRELVSEMRQERAIQDC